MYFKGYATAKAKLTVIQTDCDETLLYMLQSISS